MSKKKPRKSKNVLVEHLCAASCYGFFLFVLCHFSHPRVCMCIQNSTVSLPCEALTFAIFWIPCLSNSSGNAPATYKVYTKYLLCVIAMLVSTFNIATSVGIFFRKIQTKYIALVFNNWLHISHPYVWKNGAPVKWFYQGIELRSGSFGDVPVNVWHNEFHFWLTWAMTLSHIQHHFGHHDEINSHFSVEMNATLDYH